MSEALKYLEKVLNTVSGEPPAAKRVPPSRAIDRLLVDDDLLVNDNVDVVEEEVRVEQQLPLPSSSARPISSGGRFCPVEFMKKTCIDPNSGELLTREECDRNIKQELRNKKKIDYYHIMAKSQEEHLVDTESQYLLMLSAFHGVMINETMKKPDSRSCNQEADAVGFNIRLAFSADDGSTLPGGRKIRISSFITHNMASFWRKTDMEDAVAKCILQTAEKIAKKDTLFFLYAAPKSKRATTYVSLPDDFFVSFGGIIHAGFGISPEDMTKTIALTRDVLTNYLDRLRSDYKEVNGKDSVKSALPSFRSVLEKDSSFRAEEDTLLGSEHASE
ncbi:unnamed protein product [Caenorhabditis sp. 36 PRJEB53466]|nr:unnamed protein product [Caenorhabditis sp. 36 PRJEB53466]